MLRPLKESDFDELFRATLGMFSIDPKGSVVMNDTMIREAFRQVLIARNSCWQDFEKTLKENEYYNSNS